MSETKECAWCGKTFQRRAGFSNVTWAKVRCCSRSCGSYWRSQSPEYLAKLGAARRAWNLAHPEENAERLRKGAATKGGVYPSPNPKARGRTIARLLIPYRPCDDCGEYKGGYRSMHVHHIDLDQTNNDPSNLAVLCSTCHGKRHRGDRTRYRGGGKPRAVCRNGHQRTPENISIRADGIRRCRLCQAAATERRRLRRIARYRAA